MVTKSMTDFPYQNKKKTQSTPRGDETRRSRELMQHGSNIVAPASTQPHVHFPTPRLHFGGGGGGFGGGGSMGDGTGNCRPQFWHIEPLPVPGAHHLKGALVGGVGGEAGGDVSGHGRADHDILRIDPHVSVKHARERQGHVEWNIDGKHQ